ncbi:hypothetical protein XF_0814 [Xylella fastidiosa 9a5c]|uniref:Uncharacterized protein n=1 Tax=Xylella fastidiosa (strain 9a5c) TaxID=160492 RepID=Q9PF64_XYLFA|nr:hypothetical protein XF_0814 [Xylella fastidiosa 9a5c]
MLQPKPFLHGCLLLLREGDTIFFDLRPRRNNRVNAAEVCDAHRIPTFVGE